MELDIMAVPFVRWSRRW